LFYLAANDGVPSVVIGCKLEQNANEGCNSCTTVVQVLHGLFYVLLQLLVVAAIILSFKFYFMFYCMFYFTCDRSFTWSNRLPSGAVMHLSYEPDEYSHNGCAMLKAPQTSSWVLQYYY